MSQLTMQQFDRRLTQIEDGVEKVQKHLERPRSAVGTPRNVFAGFQKSYNGTYSWPEKQLEKMAKIAKTYNNDLAALMLKHNKRLRLCGWGKALRAIWQCNHPTKSKNLDNWTDEKIEKEFGFTSVGIAKNKGVRGPNGQRTKVALATNDGTVGGYIVPPEFMSELLALQEEDAIVESRAQVIPMNSRTMTFPILDQATDYATGTSPYFGGVQAYWQPEADTITQTNPQFRQTEWTAWDLVMYMLSSNQLLADNDIGLDALLTQLFSKACVWYKEYAFLNGTGTGSKMPIGVLNAPCAIVQTRATSNEINFADLAGMMSRLLPNSWDTAVWMAHPSTLPQFVQMVDNSTNSQLVYLNPMHSGPDAGGPATGKLPKALLNGLPLFFTEKLPQLGTKGDLILCDWGQYIIGQRLEYQLDMSTHTNFLQNQTAWRMTARCDGKPWLSDSVHDAAGWDSSPFVILNT